MVLKPLRWVGLSRTDLRGFPVSVRRNIGYALQFAQSGTKHPSAKPLRGFGGAGVIEIVEDDDANTYRAIDTLRFADAVYVLHAFQKKSKSGIKTPAKEIDLIRARLRRAEEEHRHLKPPKRENHHEA
jgi:phage-related protein